MITGLALEIGDGQRTRFWEDVWLHGGSLKERFPRLFFVSNQCGSVIGDCATRRNAIRGDNQLQLYEGRLKRFGSTKSGAIYLVWNGWLSVLGRRWSLPNLMKDHFLSWTDEPRRKEDRKQRLRCFCAIISHIWMERNRRIFRNKSKGVDEVFHMTMLSCDEWRGVQSSYC
ncbi:hypothetical protein AHAS_Ahas16G0200300 [Arachis hypogaea]